MIIILLGAPGAGKGTQARLLAAVHDIPHISTGEILRDAIKAKSALGREVQRRIEGGEFVSDDIMFAIIEERIRRNDCAAGFILDGFPRNRAQADGLAKMFEKVGLPNPTAISIVVKQEELYKRLTGRQTCNGCRRTYNVYGQRPKVVGCCDVCGGVLESRRDDESAVIQERFAEFERQTEPLIPYYRSQEILVEVNGDQSVQAIHEEILGILERNRVTV